MTTADWQPALYTLSSILVMHTPLSLAQYAAYQGLLCGAAGVPAAALPAIAGQTVVATLGAATGLAALAPFMD